MKEKTFCVDIYKFRVNLIQIENGDKYTDLPKLFLDKIESLQDEEVLDDLPTWFEDDEVILDAGYTINDDRDIYVIFSRHSLRIQQINTFAHEMYHIVRSILNYCEIDDEEAGAYLQGYIAEELASFF